MASNKPKRLAQLAWWRTHKLLFIFTVLVFAIIGFLLYQKIARFIDHRSLKQAQESMILFML